MADLTRVFYPVDATAPAFPGGLQSWSQSGVSQHRTTQQVGRSWTETYGVMQADSASTRAFLADLNAKWRAGTVFTLQHPKMMALLGTGGGTPLVNGGSQLGTSLTTDGWPVSTAILKAGDLITVAGLPYVLDITADVSSNGSGQATLSVNPPIYTSPADNAVVTASASTRFSVRITDIQMPAIEGKLFFSGLRVTFREAVV